MVILVDKKDNRIGESTKMEAHRNGLLHRAVSVLVFNTNGEMLLQRRAAGKYHSPGLWANTCCTHPLPGESVSRAALRRLGQEMCITTELTHRGSFVYKAAVGSGLTEYEYDHIFTGISDMPPHPDPAEVMQFEYMDLSRIMKAIEIFPGGYAEWFRIILKRYKHEITLWSA